MNIDIDKNKYIFWTDNPKILFENGQYINFFPKIDMTRTEQLNAITRFCIYFIVLAFVLKKDNIWFQLPIVLIVLIVILHKIFNYDIVGKISELYRTNGYVPVSGNYGNNGNNGNYGNYGNSGNPGENPDPQENYSNVSIESGYYDSNNKMHLGPVYEAKSVKPVKKVRFNPTQIKRHNTSTCRKPTDSNPLMNPILNDSMAYDSPVPCNSDDTLISNQDLQTQISDSFNKDLFRDVSDLFETKNSQRQFYTVPQSNPPDTVQFANWLYGSMPSCKSSQSACYKYEDLRYKTELL